MSFGESIAFKLSSTNLTDMQIYSERKNTWPSSEENDASCFKLSRGIRAQFMPGRVPTRNLGSALWDKVVTIQQLTLHVTLNADIGVQVSQRLFYSITSCLI